MQLPNAFVTLLTTPSYLPGALVLLHSLNELHPAPRDYKTVCLVTPETVDAKTIGELRKAGWDFVIGVEPIGSGVAGEKGLRMMGRPDLNYALTKLHLFRLHTLFSTLIYLDADVLPLRPLAHLFQTTNPHTLSACPDTGWPDCFNSGVMVIRPKESDWTGLRNLLKNGEGEEGIYLTGDAEAGGNGSFDGADQGLLNEWFSEEGGGGEWNRLPFTYNVTPSAAYTYKPAYHRYGHKINVVHFIGPNKPWANLAGRPAGMSVTKKGKDSYDYPALIDRWYDVYDRNVRPTAAHAPDLAHRFAVPEHVAVWNLASGVPAQPQDRLDLAQLRDAVDKGVTALKPGQYMSLPLDGRVDLIMPKPQPKKAKSVKFDDERMESPGAIASPTQYHAPPPQTMQQQMSQPAVWDAVHHAPPQKGAPEMSIRMDTFYAPAWEQSPAQQSAYYSRDNERQPDYPTLPASVTGDTWYKDYSGKVPDKRNIKPVFPWEQPGHSHRAPDRVFPRGSTPPPQHQRSTPSFHVQGPSPPPLTQPHRQPSPPPQPRSMSDAMASYTNAWDSMPSIQRYVKQITGRSNAPTSLGMGRRESNFDPASIQSVPPTPKGEQPEKKSKSHRRDTSIDRHSEASGDGDDEDEESSEDDAGPSPFVPAAEWKAGQQSGFPVNANVNARYQDRFAQTDNANMADAKVQAIPGGGPSPAVKTVELPPSASSTRRNSATGKRPSNVRNSSSSASASTSDALRSSSGPLTPTSDSTVTSSTVRRVPFPAGPGGAYTASPASTAKALPTHTPKSSFGGSYGNFSSSNFAGAGQTGSAAPGHGRRLSTEARTNEGVPIGRGQGQGLPQIGEGQQQRTGGGRYFSPETDLDERKKDSHAVLTRFMQEAAHAQSGGLGLK